MIYPHDPYKYHTDHTDIIFQFVTYIKILFKAVLGFYGMSEIGTISTSTTPDKLGDLAPGVKVKILSPETGNLLGPNEPGEILAKTPTMGHYINPKENEAFFDDIEGFVHTGDLGYYDENGILYCHGRLKELIKVRKISLLCQQVNLSLTHSLSELGFGVG